MNTKYPVSLPPSYINFTSELLDRVIYILLLNLSLPIFFSLQSLKSFCTSLVGNDFLKNHQYIHVTMYKII